MKYLTPLLSICISILLIKNGNCQLNVTVSQSDTKCTPDTAFLTMKCSFEMKIKVPTDTTDMQVEIFNVNSTTPALILGRPVISFGDGIQLNSSDVVYPNMISFYSDSRFTNAFVDLGEVTGPSICSDADCDSILINFDVAVIQTNIAIGSQVWLSGAVSSSLGSQVFAFSQQFTIKSENLTTVSANPTISISNVSRYNYYGEILVDIAMAARHFSLIINAASSSDSISICSIRLVNATGHTTLDSNKDFLRSVISRTKNSAYLNLGYISAYADLFGQTFKSLKAVVVYKASPKARAGDYGFINITVNVGFKNASYGANKTAFVVQNTTVGSSNSISSDAYGPDSITVMNLAEPNTYVNYNQYFNITIAVVFPNIKIYDDLIINVGDASTSDLKICSVEPLQTSGSNVVCAKCMKKDFEVVDDTTWIFKSFRLSQFAGSSFLTQDRNTLYFSIIGKLNFADYAYSSQDEYTLPMSLKIGSTSIWSGEQLITPGNYAQISSQSDQLPEFYMYYADNASDSTAFFDVPRPVYLDIFTKPLGVHGPSKINFIVPVNAGLPLAKICRVEVVHVGQYASCAQFHKFSNEDTSDSLIKYFQSLVSFTNDQAQINLEGLCNTADYDFANKAKDYNPEDSMIRFSIYFTAVPQAIVNPIEYFGITVDFDVNNIYVGQLPFQQTARINPGLAQLYVDGVSTTIGVFKNASSLPAPVFDAEQTVLAGMMSPVFYTFKTKPGSLASYNLVTNITQPTQGNASICKVYIDKRGKDIQCLRDHFYNRKESYLTGVKSSDTFNTGLVCNSDRAKVNSQDDWDEDSISVTVLMKPFRNATGQYVLSFDILENSTNVSDLTAPQSITVNVNGSVNLTSFTPPPPMGYATLNSVNPTLLTDTFVATNYMQVSPGQTVILRYNLVLNQPTFFALIMNLQEYEMVSSAYVEGGPIEIQNLFIAKVGYNYPCINPLLGATQVYDSLSNATLDAADVDFVNFDLLNISSSALTIEAFVRLPANATSMSNIKFQFNPNFDSDSNATTAFNNEIAGFYFLNLDAFTSPFDINKVFISAINSNSTNGFRVKETVTVTLNLTVPIFSNLRTRVIYSCLDAATGISFCNIESFRVISAGRNVDGLMADIPNDRISGTYNSSSEINFHNDTATLDLGVITNTGLGYKLGNYNPIEDDSIFFEVELYFVDIYPSVGNVVDTIFQHSLASTVTVELNTNLTKTIDNIIPFYRDGLETPICELEANMTQQTVFESGDLANISFVIQHTNESTATAQNLRITFFLPPYVVVNELLESNYYSDVTYTINGSAVVFTMKTLFLEHVLTGVFGVTIDPLNNYKDIVNKFGTSPPNQLPIPYTSYFNKIYEGRVDSKPAGWTFFTATQFIYYTPEPVNITSIPLNPLKNSTDRCALLSSIFGSTTAANAYNTGWQSGFRSVAWYRSGSSFVTVSFKQAKEVYRISFKQLPLTTYAQFSAFKISYSMNGVSYGEFPEIKLLKINSSDIIYNIPARFIKCRYIRIHITDVANPDDLSTKTSGLIINEIYGEASSDITQLPCVVPFNGMYVPRNYLYIDSAESSGVSNLYLCDEDLKRSSSDCYLINTNQPEQTFVLPKKISNILFWLKDLLTTKEYLYGLADDKANYLRSDDFGYNWLYVTPNEYNTVMNDRGDNVRYAYKDSVAVSVTDPALSVSENNYQINNKGVTVSGALKFNWWD